MNSNTLPRSLLEMFRLFKGFDSPVPKHHLFYSSLVNHEYHGMCDPMEDFSKLNQAIKVTARMNEAQAPTVAVFILEWALTFLNNPPTVEAGLMKEGHRTKTTW